MMGEVRQKLRQANWGRIHIRMLQAISSMKSTAKSLGNQVRTMFGPYGAFFFLGLTFVLIFSIVERR